MNLSLLLQALIAGVTNGLVYALVGMGMSAIFRGSRVVNAMQGEFSVIGAIVAVLLLKAWGLSYVPAALGGVLAGTVVGALVEFIFVRQMIRRGATEVSFLLLTIGLSLAASASVLFFVGRDSYLLPAIGGDEVYIILDAVLRIHALWLIIIAVAVALLLRLFYRKTPLGLAIMAASSNADGAATIGINVGRMRTLSFALGGLLGAVAGILITPLLSVNYLGGLALTLKGFAAGILGGLTNPMGALAGGLALGLIEALAIVWVSSAYKDVVAFSVIIAIMILMPHGILGRAGRKGG
jgi:branched-chain amino acid transport system permease protein